MNLADELRVFECLDCHVNTHEIKEYYMLHDDIWAAVHPSLDGMLCIGCVEARLGRTLTPNDFLPCPLNTALSRKSERLWSRLVS